MNDLRFFITDVFATGRYSGNQLATVLDEGTMTADEMQRVAAEFGFSETTFLLSAEPVDEGYPVRIFTPKAEIPFAGHPTLGTAAVLVRRVIGKPVNRVTLKLGVGPITVECPADSDGPFWMRQKPPEFEDGMPVEAIASVLDLGAGDIDRRWPVSQVTTGLPFTVVPVASLDALRRARVDGACYDRWVDTVWGKGILVFSIGGYAANQTVAARVFVPYLGVPEDPATGSANGCLAAYLLRHRVLGADSIDLCVGQGYEVGRPSEIFLRALRTGGKYRLDVGGRVLDVASGTLNGSAKEGTCSLGGR